MVNLKICFIYEPGHSNYTTYMFLRGASEDSYQTARKHSLISVFFGKHFNCAGSYVFNDIICEIFFTLQCYIIIRIGHK